MKYNLKTAVHVTDEFTRENLIEFFEAIKSDCNRRFGQLDVFKYTHIYIGAIWFIDNEGELCEAVDEDERLLGYTILNGVPQDWRDEMNANQAVLVVGAELYPKTLEAIIESQKESINQLETEKKELRECLENLVEYDKEYPTGRIYPYSEADKMCAALDKVIEQAKQLLK